MTTTYPKIVDDYGFRRLVWSSEEEAEALRNNNRRGNAPSPAELVRRLGLHDLDDSLIVPRPRSAC